MLYLILCMKVMYSMNNAQHVQCTAYTMQSMHLYLVF